MIVNSSDFNIAKSRSLIEMKCEQCDNAFYLSKHYIKCSIRRTGSAQRFCSHKCQGASRNNDKEVICTNCNIKFLKKPSQIRGNSFCSQSCSGSYNAKNKSHGTRRSKLEIYLEEQIKLEYPKLQCNYNSKELIGSELDFYFPDLRFAIELNGIFHYEPIYGQEKFEKIVNNDKQKVSICRELGVELVIIDSSTCNRLDQKSKDKYWNIVNELISYVKRRR